MAISFGELGISKSLRKGLNELGIKEPTEIQAKAIPTLLEMETDFIAQAKTGSGKTAAFGLPILMNIDPEVQQIQALILSPTRELCQQIAKQLFKFTKYTEKIFIESVYGGAKIDEQIRRLKRPTHIIVATPGRLLDLVERKAIQLDGINTVVLDEADEMMSMGFKKQLNQILEITKSKKQTWLFSATMPDHVKQIIKTYLSPKAKSIGAEMRLEANRDINYQYTVSTTPEKFKILLSFLNSQSNSRGLIFCNTKKSAINLTNLLIGKDVSVDVLEGGMKQLERDKVMRAFKKERIQLLVATDVAARGLDVKDLGFVVHYELPMHLDEFTHRSGRTGRAGNKGLALCLAEENETAKIKFFEKGLNMKMKLIR
ncbi:DEAD/DEAH box helicase [Reichenbachiella versicolor]|uniref:DEAD/DEAH box helicase n=1 Tax=Reichenbachiella versicolor TaxID=1821036 RepID=UPI000D6DEFB1|nr:DEAD/DEAH box helicase [Reichenbachiella versicolor]